MTGPLTRRHSLGMTNEILTSEEDLIQRYLAPLAVGYAGAFGLRDDCAAISIPPDMDLVVKTDPVRAGVHFFADDAPEDISWKALAVNISDLAAKGATPLAYLLALSFPTAPEAAWMARFAHGLGEVQAAFRCHLVGGDTDRADGPMTIAVTAFGVVATGRMVRRGTARAGDVVFVSGTLGGSALGLKLRRGDTDTVGWPIGTTARTSLRQRYLRPEPHIALGPALRAYASAAMDISDGLGKDFDRLCRASELGGRIELAHLPMDAATRAVVTSDPRLAERVWVGGDDYEILCTVADENATAFKNAAADAGVPVTKIGVTTPDRSVIFVNESGDPVSVTTLGFDHF